MDMGEILDWITLNPWALVLVIVAAAITGYAATRPAALRGASSDDPTPWVAFCMGLYPDTRPDHGAGDDGSPDTNDPGSDSSD